jgi:ATP-dependent Lhr-like helicase
VNERSAVRPTPTEVSTALAQQLLSRYGVLTREVAAAEGIYGGFSAVYDVLKAMEDAGRIRRGYFVSGVGATQFALPTALDLLRSLREMPEQPESVVLSATDPANPYGTTLPWPQTDDGGAGRPTRSVGALVVLINGALAAYISRGARQLLVWLPEDEPQRSQRARALADRLAKLAGDQVAHTAVLVSEVNGVAASEHPLAQYLVEAGFYPSAMGYQIRRTAGISAAVPAGGSGSRA